MISEDAIQASEECAMNIFSIDENKIRDANGIIFAEAITCYKCTFCGKMFAAMEVVLTHYQSNHRCSVIPLLKGITLYEFPRINSVLVNHFFILKTFCLLIVLYRKHSIEISNINFSLN